MYQRMFWRQRLRNVFHGNKAANTSKHIQNIENRLNYGQNRK